MTADVADAVRHAIAGVRASAAETVRQWRAGPEYRAIEREFEPCPPDDPGSVGARAERLLHDAGWAAELIAPLAGALARDRFFDPPLPFSRDALRTVLILFESACVTLSVSVVDAAAMSTLPPPSRIAFSGRTSVARYVRAGGATLRRWRSEPMSPEFSGADAAPCTALPAMLLRDGDICRTDGDASAHLVEKPRSDVVALTFTARATTGLVREYAIADGALMRVASADDRTSRAEMLLTWLRIAGRADARDRFEAATHDPAFHLRWAAMREWLALDLVSALPRLERMAVHDSNREVRIAARATLVAAQSHGGRRCRA